MGIVSEFYFDHDYIHGLIPLFRFSNEANVPTLYSSFALLFSSILLTIIAIAHRKNGSAYLWWLGLAMIFLFLSIDEIASIHELLGKPVRESLGTSGLLFYAWLIPYGIALIVFVVTYSIFKISDKTPNKHSRPICCFRRNFCFGRYRFGNAWWTVVRNVWKA